MTKQCGIKFTDRNGDVIPCLQPKDLTDAEVRVDLRIRCYGNVCKLLGSHMKPVNECDLKYCPRLRG